MLQPVADRGSAVVEFALVLPAVALVLLAAVEVVVVARTHLELLSAAREGARVAATTPDPAKAVEAARASLGDSLASQARVTVTRPGVVGRAAVVVVAVPHRLAGFLLGGATLELSARAVMRV